MSFTHGIRILSFCCFGADTHRMTAFMRRQGLSALLSRFISLLRESGLYITPFLEEWGGLVQLRCYHQNPAVSTDISTHGLCCRQPLTVLPICLRTYYYAAWQRSTTSFAAVINPRLSSNELPPAANAAADRFRASPSPCELIA